MKPLLPLYLTLSLIGALAGAHAARAEPIDPTGKYELVTPPQPTEVPAGKIEVVDLFWYGCPHCWRILPYVERYARNLPDDVVLRHLPAVFRKSWEAHARAFYTAEILGVTEAIHRPLFEAIHEQRRSLDSREKLRAFFVAHGVSASDFDKTYDSFAVETMLRKSMVMQQRYGVRGTPTLIVNGKYRVTASSAGGYAEALKVVAALVDKERRAAAQ